MSAMCSKIFENVISPFCGTGSVIGIGATNGAAVFVGVGVGVADEVGVGVADEVGVGDAEGAGFVTTFVHSNFSPDLTHVNFTFATVEVTPAFLQAAPAFAPAALAWGSARMEARRTNEVNKDVLRIKIYLSVD